MPKHGWVSAISKVVALKAIQFLERGTCMLPPIRIGNAPFRFQSVEELYEKCLQMKVERNIQFAVIDDFQRLALPNPDEILWQLCKIAKKFDIVLVGMKRASCNDTDEHHQPRRRRKRNQAKGLDAILRAGYAE